MSEEQFGPPGPPSNAYQWQLIESFRRRSDESANLLRALLITIATGSVGFIVNKNYGDLPNWHLASILLFGAAVAILVFSWSLQKTKSIWRLKWLRDAGYQIYLRREKEMAGKFWLRNETFDCIAMIFVAIGVGVELLVTSLINLC